MRVTGVIGKSHTACIIKLMTRPPFGVSKILMGMIRKYELNVDNAHQSDLCHCDPKVVCVGVGVCDKVVGIRAKS